MSDLNSVVLVGRLVRDPELRYTPQGAAVCDFTVATNRKYTKKDGEKAEEVAFVDITSWNRMAEVAAEFLKKGRQVALAGSLVQDRWEDEATGQKRSKIRIQAHSVQFLGGGSKDGETPVAESASEEALVPTPLVVPDPEPTPVPVAPKPAAPSTSGAKGRTPARR